MADSLNKQVVNATKWTTLSELVAKLIVPITSMVLARLLTPEIFGVVATLAMITSFAHLFTDAGFGKYIVQHEFKNEKDLYESINIAFWSNFIMSLLVWACIVVFADPLAEKVGNAGLGHVLIVSSISIPVSSFASMQSALFTRRLAFKELFKVRLVSVLIPLVTTVPLAIWLRSYWAIVLGGLVNSVIGAILLNRLSDWKPSFSYSFPKLKEMLSFSVWSQIENVSIWLTNYVDIFIVGTMLNQYYLGLYKASSSTVASIVGLITGATTPLLFASLSRLQSNENEFRQLFFRFQKLVGTLVIPVSVGIFCFSDLITAILLGSQWMEASGFVGLWGLTSGITIVLSHYASEVYRAKGRPKLSVLAQWLHILVMWPVVFIAVKYGFHVLYVARSVVRLELVLVNMIILYMLVHFSPWKMILNVMPALIASAPIFLIAFGMKWIDDSLLSQVTAIVLSSLTYVVIIYQFPVEQHIINTYIIKRKKYGCINLR